MISRVPHSPALLPPFRMAGTAAAYDMHPDGKRFIMVSEPERSETPVAQINVVVNWFEQLKRVARTGS